MPTALPAKRVNGSHPRDGSPATVLLVDDHPLLRDGLRSLLSRDHGLAVAGEAKTIAEARRLVAALAPEVVLLDFDLPDGDSLAFVKELRALPGGPKVVVLCGRDEPSGADAAALRLGASAFISKRADGAEVLRVIRDALGGKTYLSPEMIERLLRRRVRTGGDGA